MTNSTHIIGKSKYILDTPCLVLDKNLLAENIRNMQNEVDLAKKNVRPHVKTHKCIEICRQQIKAGANGIAAAKVSEAVVLADHGFKNTLITSPVVTPQKIEKLMFCLQNDPDLTVVVDNIENVKTINSAAANINTMSNILIDIDPGVGRTGIKYDEAIEFANALSSFSNIKLKGIQCYAGNLQHIQNYQERTKASLNVMKQAAKVYQQLKAAGFAVEIFSGSGTGTYSIDLQIPEVTEVQPGSYTVMDAEYYLTASAENPYHNKKFKPALTLLTSIISVNHSTHVTCDAGWKALYQVPTKPLVLKPANYEYEWFGDEHGKISPTQKNILPKLGDYFELMTAHCDPTINLFDVFYVTENDIVVDIWPIDMRGMSQ